MAIGIDYLRMLQSALAFCGSAPRILALGYPDLLVRDDDIDALLGPGVADSLPIVPQSDEIRRWHAVEQHLPHVRDSITLLKSAWNADVDVIDIVQARGGERIVDLNRLMPEDLHEAYDVVLDTGTLEHCFNVGQAFVNVASALRVGGAFVHAGPLNAHNHGFWSFNPTLYFDFFGDAGFDIPVLRGMAGHVVLGMSAIDLPSFDRFHCDWRGTSIFVVARRRELRPIAFPIQRKYRSAA
jgi:hypothetical protein